MRQYLLKNKAFFFILILSLLSFIGFSQNILQKGANDAYAITRMMDKFHVQSTIVDDTFSVHLYYGLLQKLDEKKMYFSKQDITQLNSFLYKLDDQVLTSNATFLKLVSGIYRQRIKQTDSLIEDISKKPFNFSIKESLTLIEDTAFVDNLAGMRTKIYKHLKLATAKAIAEDFPTKASAAVQMKYTDSVEPIKRKEVILHIKRSFKAFLEKESGIEKEVANSYCDAVANCYDPHSNYFPEEEKEEFESHLGKKPLIFGFYLNEDDNGNVTIDNLIPGSPAYKSGQINKGDKILAIQWSGKDKIAVAEKSAAFISDLLDQNKTEKVTLTIKKSDGSSRQVTLKKEKIDNGEDDDKVKSFVLKGTKSIGYISLPSFYIDWEDDDKGVNGCANDVAKEIIKLKQEKIDGLIIDVRYNGGGSVKEAIELSGIFIDAGAVAQMKYKTGKAITLKDMNRGTVYDGPLAIMVNGYSASASEIFAGTMQDYNRAIVVGQPTFGKATGQMVLPLDTTLSKEEDAKNKKADTYLKVTDIKVFRVSGNTAQAVGVKPDVLLPDVLSVKAKRESDESYALQVAPIDANKYYQPFAPITTAPLKLLAENEVNTSADFAEIKKKMKRIALARQKKDKSLLLADVLTNQAIEQESEQEDTTDKKTITDNGVYTVFNHAYETKRLQADSDLKDMNDEWRGFIVDDPYIKTVYKLLVQMAGK